MAEVPEESQFITVCRRFQAILMRMGEAHNDCASGAGEVVILIHDAARAEITSEVIDRNIAAMRDNEATCTVFR